MVRAEAGTSLALRSVTDVLDCERLPSSRDGARRLGPVTLSQMTQTLVSAVENPSVGGRFIKVPQIRRGGVLA